MLTDTISASYAVSTEHVFALEYPPNELGCCRMGEDNAAWYVGQSSSDFGAAHKAVNACCELGFRAWLPQIIVYRQKMVHGRPVFVKNVREREETVKPLFNNYWFVSFDIDRPGWGEILRNRHVTRLITRASPGGRVPVKLPAGFVETMQSLGRPGDGALPERILKSVNDKGWVSTLEKSDEPEIQRMKRGQAGVILEGVLASHPATVDMDLGERIFVWAEVFGRLTRVELNADQFGASSN